jgi:hypothetical protein
MPLHPLFDLSPADWFAARPYDEFRWGVLVGLGPAGFDAYARLMFEAEVTNEPARATFREILSQHTSTPDVCYFGLWEGYGGDPPLPPAGPHFSVRTWIDEADRNVSMREYHLYGGNLADDSEFGGLNNEPHMVWPADHAWFVACDVDQDWIGVGGTQDLVDELLADESLDAVPAAYGPPPPGYT